MASRLKGDWKRIGIALKDLHTLPDKLQDLSKQEANYLKTELQNTIKFNRSGGVSLKQSTIDKKGSNIKLQETGELRDSIKVTNVGNSMVIAPMGVHSSGLTNQELAMIHEYGNSKVPARPFVRPTWERNEDKVKAKFINLVTNELKKY